MRDSRRREEAALKYNEELEAGLRLNGFAVAVNGVYVCPGQRLRKLGAYGRPARPAVLRGGEALTVDVPANRHAMGDNDIMEQTVGRRSLPGEQRR